MLSCTWAREGKMRNHLWVCALLPLAACVSANQVYFQRFTITSADATIACHGAYSRAATDVEVRASLTCNDGRTGPIAIRTRSDGHPTLATASLDDGSVAHVRFRPVSTGQHAYADAINLLPPPATYVPAAQRPRAAPASSSYSSRSASRRYHTGPRGGCYYINSSGNRSYVDRSYCR